MLPAYWEQEPGGFGTPRPPGGRKVSSPMAIVWCRDASLTSSFTASSFVVSVFLPDATAKALRCSPPRFLRYPGGGAEYGRRLLCRGYLFVSAARSRDAMTAPTLAFADSFAGTRTTNHWGVATPNNTTRVCTWYNPPTLRRCFRRTVSVGY